MISPSILSADFAKLGEEIDKVTKSGADLIHVDIMDGNFVPNITIGPDVVKAIRKYSDLPFDVHLMIQNPINYVENFASAGADYITIHVEAEGNVEETLKKIRSLGKKAGISLNPGTDVKEILDYLPLVDLILVMSVQPGFGGQSFKPNALEKISFLRKEIDSKKLNILISVDGGINRETGKQCVDAGVDILAAGSYLFKQKSMADEIKLWKKF